MNLTDANLKNKPTWQQEYVTKVRQQGDIIKLRLRNHGDVV